MKLCKFAWKSVNQKPYFDNLTNTQNKHEVHVWNNDGANKELGSFLACV